MVNLYGIRIEFFIENNKQKENPIFLLTKKENGKIKRYELFLNSLKFREVDTFIAPNFIIKGVYLLDLERFVECKKNNEPFKDSLFSLNDNPYDIKLMDNLSMNKDFVKCCESPRIKEHRPVYIFNGPSGLGKSYIASFLSNLKNIYETDSSDTLPSTIDADIIVLGNKYHFSKDDIISRLPKNSEIIFVDFYRA